MHSDFEREQRIYSIPNIYENINQLFIDNLEGPEITLDDLLNKSVEYIMSSTEVFNKDIIFNII